MNHKPHFRLIIVLNVNDAADMLEGYSIDAIGQNMNTAFNTLGKIEFETLKSA